MLLRQLTEEHDLEVLWLLYLLLETQDPITMDTNVVDKIVQGKNELAQIMLLRKGVLTEEQKQLLAEKSTSWIWHMNCSVKVCLLRMKLLQN